MKILSENSDGSIEVLEPEGFDLEVSLQELLEQHPELVLADLPSDDGRAIWTIGWEVNTSAGTVDLLMLDSTGRVWVVETKLASNAEIKKQVVGQVLGYASAIASWDAERLESVGTDYITQRDEAGHLDLVEFLAEQLGSEEAAQQLLEKAAERLALGDLTALIVVDDVPKQLRRLVEFVNGHASFELLALKVQVLRNGPTRLFIPSVIGAVSVNRGARERRQRRQWDRISFLAELSRSHPETLPVAEDLIEWVTSNEDLEPDYGTGAVMGGFMGVARLAGDDWIPAFAIYTNGRVQPTWRYRRSHQDQPFWEAMVTVIRELSGVEQRLDKTREFSMTVLAKPDAMSRFKDVVLATVDKARLAVRTDPYQ